MVQQAVTPIIHAIQIYVLYVCGQFVWPAWYLWCECVKPAIWFVLHVNKRKCVVVEVGYDEKIIRLFPPATCLRGNLFWAIMVVLMRTCLVKLAVDGHVGGDVKVEVIQAIISLLLCLVKECRKDRPIQSTLQVRQSRHLFLRAGIRRQGLPGETGALSLDLFFFRDQQP